MFAVRDFGNASDDNWKVRVAPNIFPALRIEEDRRRQQEDRLFRSMGGCGAHEVIVDSRSPTKSLAQQPVEQMRLLPWTLQRRYLDLMGDPRFQTIIMFKKHGERASTSLAHRTVS